MIVNNTKFPADVVAAAKYAKKVTGCPPSVALAQWAVESYYGTQMPPGSNNPFGMKATGDQPFVECETKEGANSEIKTVAKFRKFASMNEAFIEHGKLLMNPRGPYRNCLPSKDNPGTYIQCMAPIYAADKSYVGKLRAVIQQYGLLQYDA